MLNTLLRQREKSSFQDSLPASHLKFPSMLTISITINNNSVPVVIKIAFIEEIITIFQEKFKECKAAEGKDRYIKVRGAI